VLTSRGDGSAFRSCLVTLLFSQLTTPSPSMTAGDAGDCVCTQRICL
jgi:hypothetical protein